MMAGTRRMSRWGPSILALLPLAGCFSTNDASLSVRLTYPQEGAAAGPALAGSDAPARPAYVKAPENRILIRLLAPHIPTPIEARFARSLGRGEITGLPLGDRVAVEVDEYDTTA